MKSIGEYNPIVTFCYFLGVGVFTMFMMHPVMLGIAIIGAVTFFTVLTGKKGLHSHLFSLLLLCVTVLINMLFVHNGVTVLFMMNGNAITWESVFYGILAGLLMLAVIYWFRCMSHVMTNDKYLYLFGRVSPKLGLMLSMSLRYIPLFHERSKAVRSSQKAVGLYKENTLIDKIRSEIRIFSIMVTWALENGVNTADSMEARGYGAGKRTSFSLFKFTASDTVMLLLIAVLLGICIAGAALGYTAFTVYPEITFANFTAGTAVTYGAYGILCFLPTILEGGERVKWHSLQSKI